MTTHRRRYIDAHGRPEIVADPSFKAETAALHAASTSGEDYPAENEAFTDASTIVTGGDTQARS